MVTLQDKLLAIYKRHGAITDQELAKLAGIPENSARPGRLQLEKQGLITKTSKAKGKDGKIITCAAKKTGYHRLYKLTDPEITIQDLKKALDIITKYIQTR